MIHHPLAGTLVTNRSSMLGKTIVSSTINEGRTKEADEKWRKRIVRGEAKYLSSEDRFQVVTSDSECP